MKISLRWIPTTTELVDSPEPLVSTTNAKSAFWCSKGITSLSGIKSSTVSRKKTPKDRLRPKRQRLKRRLSSTTNKLEAPQSRSPPGSASTLPIPMTPTPVPVTTGPSNLPCLITTLEIRGGQSMRTTGVPSQEVSASTARQARCLKRKRKLLLRCLTSWQHVKVHRQWGHRQE